VRRFYASFGYQSGSWDRKLRVKTNRINVASILHTLPNLAQKLYLRFIERPKFAWNRKKLTLGKFGRNRGQL
jgi:hypothetical protein